MNQPSKLASLTDRSPARRHTLHGKILALLPLLLLAGCFRHKVPPPPPVAAGPPAQPASITQIPEMPPPMPDSARPQVDNRDTTAVVIPPPAPRVHHSIRRKRVLDGPSTATLASTAPAATSTAGAEQGASGVQAANKPPELGQLSAGNGADTKERSTMIDQIHGLELRLAGLKHPQTGEEETTETNIRLFLAKARQATQANDLDGARTLALKAKVLLDELSDL